MAPTTTSIPPPPPVVVLKSPAADDDINVIFESLVTKEQAESAVILASSTDALFHEAGIWMPRTREWVVTSNRLKKTSGSSDDKEEDPHVIISAIGLDGNVRALKSISDNVPMGNGGTADGAGGVYLCSQGLRDVGGAIYHATDDGKQATAIVGGPNPPTLNSPNDICVYQKKWLLFTDPCYGHEQGFRSAPQNGNFVWYASTEGTAVAPLITTGLVKPNGICLSPDQRTLYVTDTGHVDGTGQTDPSRPRHVLAYDISLVTKNGDDGTKDSPYPCAPVRVSNPRILFRFCCDSHGVPDGIKVDVDGNIYVGASDGARIYEPSSGKLVGVLGLEGGVANLCFGGDDLRDLLLLNETRAIQIRLQRPGVNLQPDYQHANTIQDV